MFYVLAIGSVSYTLSSRSKIPFNTAGGLMTKDCLWLASLSRTRKAKITSLTARWAIEPFGRIFCTFTSSRTRLHFSEPISAPEEMAANISL